MKSLISRKDLVSFSDSFHEVLIRQPKELGEGWEIKDCPVCQDGQDKSYNPFSQQYEVTCSICKGHRQLFMRSPLKK